MLLYVAWIACWQAVFDPRLSTEASENALGSNNAENQTHSTSLKD
jgi:hypothetical protein